MKSVSMKERLSYRNQLRLSELFVNVRICYLNKKSIKDQILLLIHTLDYLPQPPTHLVVCPSKNTAKAFLLSIVLNHERLIDSYRQCVSTDICIK